MLKPVGVSLAVLISTLSPQVGHAAVARVEGQSPLSLSGERLLWNAWTSDPSVLVFARTDLVKENLPKLREINFTVPHRVQNTFVDPKQETTQTEADQIFNESLKLWKISRWQDALEKLEQALILYRELGGRRGEALTLKGFGTIADNLGQYPQALEYYNQALLISRQVRDRAGEGGNLNNIGSVYRDLGQYPQALEYYDQSLVISREVRDHLSEGVTLNNSGRIYNNLGQYSQALEYFEQSLIINRETGNRTYEGATLNNIGGVYDNLGQYSQALEYFKQSLVISREIENRAYEGATLNNIGRIYDNFVEYHQALKYFEQSLAISREIGDRAVESTTLNNIGGVHRDIGQYSQALNYYEESLVVSREIGNRAVEGSTLDNIGSVYDALAQYPQALDYYGQALAIRREIGDRAGEGVTLNNTGLTYNKSGQYAQALDYYEQALVIRREIGDRAGEGIILNNISWLLKRTEEPELAIIFLKQSVSVFEDIREDNQVLTQEEQQQSYTDTISKTYRGLADLLLQENRVLEAQAVLDLLRTQELEDYFQDVRSSSNITNDVDYWKPEENILTLYQQFLSARTDLAALRSQPYETLSPEDVQRLEELQAQENTLTTNFNDFIDRADVQEDVAALRKATTGDIELDTLTDLQNNIANLPNALVIYPLIFEDRLELILVPSDAPPIRRRVEVTSTELNQAILDYRNILRNPTRPAKPAALKLYNWLIAEIEPDLQALDTKTIVYSPDGALRYIPLAAIHDGTQWLAERFAPDRITLYGRSLGTSIAAELASRVAAQRLILETPFDNLRHSL